MNLIDDKSQIHVNVSSPWWSTNTRIRFPCNQS